MQTVTNVTKEPTALPQASEELIAESKTSYNLYPDSPTHSSSQGCSNSLGSRKSSVCSISSMNSSGSSGSPGHQFQRSLSQVNLMLMMTNGVFFTGLSYRRANEICIRRALGVSDVNIILFSSHICADVRATILCRGSFIILNVTLRECCFSYCWCWLRKIELFFGFLSFGFNFDFSFVFLLFCLIQKNNNF